MQPIPKRYLTFIYAEGKQTAKRIIQIVIPFLPIFGLMDINLIHISFCASTSFRLQFEYVIVYNGEFGSHSRAFVFRVMSNE